MSTTADPKAILAGIRDNPVTFCREVMRFSPWSKQAEIIESVRDNRRTAVRSCHGAGKTAIAARTVLWFLAAYPHSTVITTAPTWPQVKEQLWREIARGFESAEGFFDGNLSQTQLELAHDWFALGLSTDKPERFQGYHAEHILLVVDEASGVDDRIFEAGEGFLTSAGARVLLIGNPTQLAGQFYRAFHSEASLWSRIAISALETPEQLVAREWIEDKKHKWGTHSPLYAIRVLGEFPSEAEDTVCGVHDVEQAQLREIPEKDLAPPLVVSCDVARFGSDQTVICVRFGNRVRIADVYHGRDLMETAGRVQRVAAAEHEDKNLPVHIVVDDIGLGGGVTDRLRETSSFSIHAYSSARGAHDPTEYPNRRSEVWFEFAGLLPELDLDADPELLEDLVAPTYKIDSSGRRVVEPKEETKKRLGRSPDRGDSALMCFAFNPAERTNGRVSADERRGPLAGLVEKIF